MSNVIIRWKCSLANNPYPCATDIQENSMNLDEIFISKHLKAIIIGIIRIFECIIISRDDIRESTGKLH